MSKDVKFLKGNFVKLWDRKYEVWQNVRETLINVDDIKRIKACKLFIYDPESKKNIGSRNSLIISAENRVQDSDDTVNLYELTDPLSVIAEVIGRTEEELSTMLLQLEVS